MTSSLGGGGSRRRGVYEADAVAETEADRPRGAKAQRLGDVQRQQDSMSSMRQGGINIVERDDGKACSHEVAWPDGHKDGGGASASLPPPRRPGPPAREYPFTIDPFQQTAINCLEAGHSVLVAAHTSAGKTVVAEYAFAMALRDKGRVVYTSPLKALSNQKYRELVEEFADVGLMTGDVTINPNASCLVMTTEILRSMLYRGSEVVREVSLIVYDEIHYLRDKERGVVWEESIILAPKAARFAFLSATLPNAAEFAAWVAKTHGSPVHVVYTDYRPTPLQHYMFPAGGNALYMVVDEKGTFREDHFQQAVAAIADTAAAAKTAKGAKGQEKKVGEGKGEDSDIYKIVRMIIERNYDPVIVFSFSKKECESLVENMAGLDLTDADEKKLVGQIYESAMECLSTEDRRLPQIAQMLPTLRRGIGLHHSGLLPIVKEVIEILFSEGLLKVLFATETFSTGLNMPAKTVVFTHARKFDGGGFRWISSGEYIQMSGRAGRRGLDDRGIVILMLDAKMEPSLAKEMIKGAPDPLRSAFHLGYNMLLNLMLSVEATEPEQLLEASFRQYQVERSIPQLQQRVEALKAAHDAIQIPDEADVVSYNRELHRLAELTHRLRSAAQAPESCLPFLQPGRLVRMCGTAFDASRPLPDFSTICADSSPADDSSDTGSAHRGASSSSSGTDDSSSIIQAVTGGVWGTIINFQRMGKRKDGGGWKPGGPAAHAGAADDSDDDSAGKNGRTASNYLLDVLINTDPSASAAAAGPAVTASASDPASGPTGGAGAVAAAAGQRGVLPKLLPPGTAGGTPVVLTFPLTQLDALSSVRVYLPKELRPLPARQEALRVVAESLARLQRNAGGVPLLELEKDLKVHGKKSIRQLQSKLEDVESALKQHPLASLPAHQLRSRLAALQAKTAAAEAVEAAVKEAKAATSLILKDELKARQRVLRRLDYVNSAGVVQIKGRVAASITCADPLVLSQMIFDGAFNGLNVGALAAVMSCFVWTEKSAPAVKLREELRAPFNALKDAARHVARVSLEARLPDIDVDAFVEAYRPDLMEAIAAWATGGRFADVLKLAGVFEGSLVRAVRRLEELLRQVKEALDNIGDIGLASVFEAARVAIKRDIAFAASLYL